MNIKRFLTIQPFLEHCFLHYYNLHLILVGAGQPLHILYVLTYLGVNLPGLKVVKIASSILLKFSYFQLAEVISVVTIKFSWEYAFNTHLKNSYNVHHML